MAGAAAIRALIGVARGGAAAAGAARAERLCSLQSWMGATQNVFAMMMGLQNGASRAGCARAADLGLAPRAALSVRYPSRRAVGSTLNRPRLVAASVAAAPRNAVRPEGEVPGMSAYLESLRWNSDGLVAVIAQARAAGWKGCCSCDCGVQAARAAAAPPLDAFARCHPRFGRGWQSRAAHQPILVLSAAC